MLVLLVLVFAVRVVTLTPQLFTLPILYSSQGFDSAFQTSLLRGVLTALRDASTQQHFITPKLLDLSKNPSSSNWIVHNNPRAIVSLLPSEQLCDVCDALASGDKNYHIHIFTPRTLGSTSHRGNITVTSMQMNVDARITTLLHRTVKMGIKSLIPLLDSINQLPLLAKYHQTVTRSYVDLEIFPPIFMSQSETLGMFSSANISTAVSGILLLATHLTPEVKHRLVEKEHYFRWFTHEATHELDTGIDILGLYSVNFVGSGQWDNVKRRRMLREFQDFTAGPNPTILSVALAYDAAAAAIANIRKQNFKAGLTGHMDFIRGSRRQGSFFGFSRLPKKHASGVGVLHSSDWILEDALELSTGQDGHLISSNHQVATSSYLSRDELITIIKAARERRKCSHVKIEVLAHDPFTEQEYRYHFLPQSLPDHLLIPNQYGYGLTVECGVENAKHVAILRVACVPTANFVGAMVNCFKSNVFTRQKRSPTYPESSKTYLSPYYRKGGTYYGARNGASTLYYQPGSDTLYQNGFGDYHDSSTPRTLTTRLDVPINEDPTTRSPTGGSKLPELRQILKAAKPFVGSCIGSSTGCAVCVLVLGRLPLGALPAACTGPCFVGTFGTCGSLLGRVFSETTVICTELFRQGLLDLDTFLADAEFGQLMAETERKMLVGYHLMASPVVQKMKESETLSRIVAFVASPWTAYMKYVIGHTDDINWVGYVIHTIGSTFCHLIGCVITNVHIQNSSVYLLGYSLGAILLGIVFMMRYLNSKKSSRSQSINGTNVSLKT